MYITSDLSTWL